MIRTPIPVEFKRVLELFPDVVEDNKAWYNTTCPVCDRDKFGFKESAKGYALFNCYRECCDGAELLEALGVREVAAFDFEDAKGNVVAQRVRIEYARNIDADKKKPHKQFLPFRVVNGARAERSGLGKVHLSWYRRSEVRAAAASGNTIWICEGEGKADVLRDVLRTAGRTDAVTSPPGGKVTAAMAAELRGASTVVVLGDNDKTGREKARIAADLAAAVVDRVRLIEALPGVGGAGDIADWLVDGGTLAALDDLANAAPIVAAPQSAVPAKAHLRAGGWDLYLDQDHQPCVDINENGRRATYRVRSTAFRNRVINHYFEADGKAPSDSKIREELATLGAVAHSNDRVELVYKRTAEHDGRIYIDLADKTYRAVEIDADGWRIVDVPPVRFWRTPHMSPLPEPARGGSFTDLRRFLNTTDEDWPLIAGWLVGALRPRKPYAIMMFAADAGSGKTTATRVLQQLVDPSAINARSTPKDDQTVAIAACNSHALVFDNLSSLPMWLSNMLCMISTGGVYAGRTLYTNDEETALQMSNPVLLTSIDELGYLPDFFSRTYNVHLAPIDEAARLTEDELWAAFEKARPRLLGAIYDTLSLGLRRFAEVKADGAPLIRLGDVEVWVKACEPAFGTPLGTYSTIVRKNFAASDEVVVDSSPIAEPLRDMVAQSALFETVGDLKLLLDSHPKADLRNPHWPKSAAALASKLNRVKSSLGTLGYVIEQHVKYEGLDGRRKVKRWLIAANEKDASAAHVEAPF